MADPLLRVYVRGAEREIPPMLWSPDDLHPLLSALVDTYREYQMWVVIVGAPGAPEALCTVHSVWLGTSPPTLPEHGRLKTLQWIEKSERSPRT